MARNDKVRERGMKILAFAGVPNEALFQVYEPFVGARGNSGGTNKRITKIFVFTTCEVSFRPRHRFPWDRSFQAKAKFPSNIHLKQGLKSLLIKFKS
jgi:hypothetical protein